MPELDESAPDGISTAVQHAAADIGDDAACGGEAIVEKDEVVVLVEGDILGERVVGALGDLRGEGKGFSKVSRKGEPGGCS